MDPQDAAGAVLDRTRATCRPALRAALRLLDDGNRSVAEYHLGFRDARGTEEGDGAPSAGGKMIRAALALLSARAAGTPDGRVSAEPAVGDRAVAAAVGIELAHQYSLLHDDIIDEDDLRRHRPTAWTVFGRPAAILAGDAMAALALEVVLAAGDTVLPASDAAYSLAVATRRMAAGQAADMAFETAEEVTMADSLAMVADKTGALIECAATIGARASGAETDLIEALADYGRHLGVAFQLVDDLLGLWGVSAATGKPAGADIAARKKSLPVVAALAAGGPHAVRLAEIYRTPGELPAADIDAALAAIDAAGGRAWARAEADRHTQAALRILDSAAIDDGTRSEMTALTVMLCARDR